jgi:hypothetical protein
MTCWNAISVTPSGGQPDNRPRKVIPKTYDCSEEMYSLSHPLQKSACLYKETDFLSAFYPSKNMGITKKSRQVLTPGFFVSVGL